MGRGLESSSGGVGLACCVVVSVVGSLAAARSVEASEGPDTAPSVTAPPSGRVHVEDIVIVGVEQVGRPQLDRILRQEGLVPGTRLLWPEDDPRVQRARERLRSTGYFRRVTLRLKPVAGERGRAVLVVDVEERPSLSITDVHLGSSELTPFRGGLELHERNFLGRAVHLGGGFVWGTLPDVPRSRRQQAYRLAAEIPRLGSTVVGLSGSAYVVSAAEPYRVSGARDDPDPTNFRTFDYTRLGGILGLTFAVLPRLSLGVDYRFERVGAFVPTGATYLAPDGTSERLDLAVRDGQHRHTSAQFVLAWDGRDDAHLTGKGGRFVLDLRVSSPAIGSAYEYVKLVAGGAYTFRLPWRHWITPALTAGQISGSAPRFELFYSGDLSDWTPGREQGLRYSTRNPIDVFGTGIDTREFGVLFARVDLEYVWPLFRRARTRAFYGGELFFSAGVFTLAGNAAERRIHAQLDQAVAPIGFNANVGLRLETALGTFDISVGNILRRTPL